MIKTIFLKFIAVVGLPIYALCVAFLLLLKPLFGWSYVDASVYVCEYFQPVFTAAVALLLLLASCKVIVRSYRGKRHGKLTAILLFDAVYIFTGTYCITQQLMTRIATYSGMSNRQIFDYAVDFLSNMAREYPDGSTMVRILDFDTVSYGYIMANIEVYIAPIAVILILGIIQCIISKKLKRDEIK